MMINMDDICLKLIVPPHDVSGNLVITSRTSTDKKIVLCDIYTAHHKNEKRG
jgi:hypothetical protein